MADDLVTAVKEANDIVAVVGEYVALHKRGRVYKGLCPFHDDHTPSLDVDPGRQRFRCWACGKFGDVFTFVQEKERLDFREALELLARRANIPLRRASSHPDTGSRTRMLDAMAWAEECYHRCLMQSAEAEKARQYLADRRLTPDTIERYRLGYAPRSWDWLSRAARQRGVPTDLLVTLGLLGRREEDGSTYDRFRERVMFPIRDGRGRTVGFGGRILPSASATGTAPKYYNSADTPLFTKSEHLYGLDQARAAAATAGYLAVVEGYTDVLMAHQLGVLPVVATLGTALNDRHLVQLRRLVPRVVLVFDADAGGARGIDSALHLFVSQDVELAIATLPAGLDPCDYLEQYGADAFRSVVESARDALDFMLDRALAGDRPDRIEQRREAVEQVLRVLALVPNRASAATRMKCELAVTRLSQRCGIRPETIWQRLAELRRQQRTAHRPANTTKPSEPVRTAPADPAERLLLEVLLAEPGLVARVRGHLNEEEIAHPGLRRLLTELYQDAAAGREPNVDQLRLRLSDKPKLAEYVVRLQAAGEAIPRRGECLGELIEEFERRRRASGAEEIRHRLQSAPSDGPPPAELLRRLQEQPPPSGRPRWRGNDVRTQTLPTD